MAGNGTIGALLVSLGVDTAAFETGLKGANKTAKTQFGLMHAAVAGFAGGLAAELGQRGLGALKAFGMQAINTADDIGDAAARIGVSSTEFQKLQIAAVAAGGSTEVMGAAMDKLNQNLGAAHMGSKEMSAAFQKLGLDAAKLQTADQAFYAIAGAMEKIKDPAEKAKLSMQFFGKAAGVDMLEVLAVGETALHGYGEAALNTGRIMSEDMVKRLGDAKTKIEETKTSISQMATVMAGEAVIAIMDLSNQLKEDANGQLSQFTDNWRDLQDAFNATDFTIAKDAFSSLSQEIIREANNIVWAITSAINALNWMQQRSHEWSKYWGFPSNGNNNPADPSRVRGGSNWGTGNVATPAIMYGDRSGSGSRGGSGGGGSSRGRGSSRHTKTKDYNAENAAAIRDAIQEASDIIERITPAAQQATIDYAKAVETLTINYKLGGATLDQTKDQIAALTAQYNKQAETLAKLAVELPDGKALTIPNNEDLSKMQNDVEKTMSEASRSQAVQDAWTETVRSGFDAMRHGDFFDWFKERLYDSIWNAAADAFAKAFPMGDTSSGGGGIGGVLASIASSIFGGARASGGSVASGKAYLVGERGPEIFSPARNGSIIPNDAIGGSGNVIHLTVNDIVDGKVLDSRIYKISTDVTGAAVGGLANQQQKSVNYNMNRSR